ncbi:glycosyltransferase [Asticcacaulis sp. AC466]|uniref:glycosyltransferase n=1 Tax=Asticcacaulis sp. AC466 TaxID=1282362 RepID=UPI0003FF45C0|nr:glycosyltransferase [Asticcacaulis sp. AC466]
MPSPTSVQTIVMATHGSFGDLHPFIALGQALKARGCRVTLATHPDYAAKVEAAGLAFVAFGPSREDYVRDLRVNPAEIIRRLSNDHGFMIKRLIAPYLERSIRDIAPYVAEADAVLGSPFAYGAHIAALLAGKPFTTVALQPTVMMSSYDPPKVRQAPFIFEPSGELGRAYNRLIMAAGEQIMAASQSQVRRVYRKYGLHPRVGLGGIVSDHRTLALYSPLLAQPQPDFPPRTYLAGFPFYDSENGHAPVMPERLLTFLNEGPAPLVFSLGTAMVYGGEAYYRTAIAAAKRLNRRAVILSGPESPLLKEEFGLNICVVPYAPHSLLLPRCELIVHHGGIGSTAQALRAGRPQLVTPVFGDQFDNARRVTLLGTGLRLDFDDFTVERAVMRLRQVLYSDKIAAAAQAVAPLIAAEDGAERAADVLLNARNVNTLAA